MTTLCELLKHAATAPCGIASTAYWLCSLLLSLLLTADEIDAIGTKRYDSHSGGEREIQRTMLELLNQMDGFDALSEVKVGPASAGCRPRGWVVRVLTSHLLLHLPAGVGSRGQYMLCYYAWQVWLVRPCAA